MPITAKVIADSEADGVRITTLSLLYPRFILAEFNTHRMLSRNSASSRAIPTRKLIEEVRYRPATPVGWGKNKSGMQATEELEGKDLDYAKSRWTFASNSAAMYAEDMLAAGAHKQIANRILEPYLHAQTVVTATEWDNFFKLRMHKDAQPEIHVLAIAMHEAMENSKPKYLQQGEWHLPYDDTEYGSGSINLTRSIARCARVSYMTHNGQDSTGEQDFRLATRLRESGHWSPFEHQATPQLSRHLWSNNFRGFKQLREILSHEPGYKIS